MSISWPDEEGFDPVDFDFGIDAPFFGSRSLFTGGLETNRSPFSRWLATMVLPAAEKDLHAEREGFLAGLLANDERVLLHNFVRPTPRGTLAGLPTLSAPAAQFANSLSIACTTGVTLLRGDMIAVSNQLFMVTAPATSVAGVMVVDVAGRVRTALSAGAAVVWDSPTGRFLLSERSAMFSFKRSYGERITLAFEEDWL